MYIYIYRYIHICIIIYYMKYYGYHVLELQPLSTLTLVLTSCYTRAGRGGQRRVAGHGRRAYFFFNKFLWLWL